MYDWLASCSQQAKNLRKLSCKYSKCTLKKITWWMGVSSAFVHVTAWRSMRDADHVTLNLKNSMSTAEAYLDIEKALETTWHPGLLYELNKVHFPSILFKFLSSFLSSERFRATIESEMSTPRDIQARMPQGSVLNLSLYSLYINYTPQNLRDYLSPLCRWYMCIYSRSQRGFCSQKAAARDHLNGVVVSAMEHKSERE